VLTARSKYNVRYTPNSGQMRASPGGLLTLASMLAVPALLEAEVTMSRGIRFVSFCALATTLIASYSVRANTIVFECGTSIAVDLAKNAVNNQPATISETVIDLQMKSEVADDTGVVYYHIDRITNILTENFKYRLPSGRTQSDDPTTYRCTVGSATPTIPR